MSCELTVRFKLDLLGIAAASLEMGLDVHPGFTSSRARFGAGARSPGDRDLEQVDFLAQATVPEACCRA